MSRKGIDYPHASLKKSIDLAQGVYEIGGSCSAEMCAEKLGMKVGGGFRGRVTAATKYGLITNTRGQIETTQLYRDYHLGYSKEEKIHIMRSAFLHVPLFNEIYMKFKDQKLPTDIFDRLLIREFSVNEQVASRVSKYFIEGAKASELLNPDNTFWESSADDSSYDDEDSTGDEDENEEIEAENNVEIVDPPVDSTTYTVRITGPGINSVIAINDEDDLDIVNVMLNKVKKKLME
jgi:hypothetical protein